MSLEQAMFNQAFAFAKNSADLYEKGLKYVPRDGHSLVPWVVNSAFSIEIYLKTIGQIHGKKMHGHELRILFDNLPSQAQEEILKAAPKALASRGFHENFDLLNELSKLNRAFIDWRYCYQMGTLDGNID